MLVTTLTKRMAEDLTDFLTEHGVRVRYLHSDIDTVERVEIIRDLRLGTFDVLVGINLLREGLDIPEVDVYKRQAKLRVAGAPNLEPKTEGVGEDTLAFTATFEVYPEVAVPDLSALAVTRYETAVTDAEVQQTLDCLLYTSRCV